MSIKGWRADDQWLGVSAPNLRDEPGAERSALSSFAAPATAGLRSVPWWFIPYSAPAAAGNSGFSPLSTRHTSFTTQLMFACARSVAEAMCGAR